MTNILCEFGDKMDMIECERAIWCVVNYGIIGINSNNYNNKDLMILDCLKL